MAEWYDLTMSVNDSNAGTTNPVPGTTGYLSGSVVPIEALEYPGYFFIDWTGNVANNENPVTTVTMYDDEIVIANFGEDHTLRTGDSYTSDHLSDSVDALIASVVDSLRKEKLSDYADSGFAFWSPAQLLRGPQVPADPYYDHDSDSGTEEMLMYDGTAKFLETIGTDLYSGVDDWNSLTLAEKLKWIQDFEP